MAAATKLNPAAPPFPFPDPCALRLAPPAPPPFPLADAAWPPRFPFVTYCCVAPPPAGHIGFCFPVQPQPSPQPGVVGKGGVPAAHGRPPHKLMAAFSGLGGAGKRQAGAVKPWKEPAPAALAAAEAPALVPAAPRKPWVARRKEEERSVAKAKAPRPRKAAGPRARKAAQAQREGSPPPPTSTPLRYTTRRLRCCGPPPKPEDVLGSSTTTIMLRNIPNKLRSSDMISLLDQHCKRANDKDAGAVVSAYDVLYLPMDFRRGCNFGYAFVNLTSPEAAHRLYRSLEGCGWSVHGSKKVIRIDPAKIQGKELLVRHLQGMKLQCPDEEFLPAAFSPPRDGVTAGTTVWRLGRLARRSATTTPPAAAPTPKESC